MTFGSLAGVFSFELADTEEELVTSTVASFRSI